MTTRPAGGGRARMPASAPSQPPPSSAAASFQPPAPAPPRRPPPPTPRLRPRPDRRSPPPLRRPPILLDPGLQPLFDLFYVPVRRQQRALHALQLWPRLPTRRHLQRHHRRQRPWRRQRHRLPHRRQRQRMALDRTMAPPRRLVPPNPHRDERAITTSDRIRKTLTGLKSKHKRLKDKKMRAYQIDCKIVRQKSVFLGI